MNQDELERLVQAAVRAVLEQLNDRPATPPAKGPTVRLVIGESDAGLDFAFASLKQAERRYRLQVVLATGQERQVTLGYVREALNVPDARPESEAGCPLRFAQGADVALVVGLDRPALVRSAMTAPERYADRFLFEALCLGKPVVLAQDGLDRALPDASPRLRQAMAEPLGLLEAFGATVTAASDVAAAIDEALAGPARFNAAVNRPLITAEDVEAADGELVLAPGAIVTPLALERARELGVVLRRVPH